MWWPFQWLFIYVLGGLTFVPLAIALTIGYVYKYGSVPVGDDDTAKFIKKELQDKADRDEMLQREKDAIKGTSTNSAKPLSGWLTVRRQFTPTAPTTSIFMPNMSNTSVSSEPGVIDTEETVSEKDDASIRSGTSTPMTTSLSATSAAPTVSSTPTIASNGQPSTYSARIAQTYRQMMDARTRKESTPKEYFFCVLKGRVLFMYDDEAQTECVAALGVDKYMVGVESKEGGRFSGKDAEMFAKRNAIVLRAQERGDGAKTGLSSLTRGMSGIEGTEEDKEAENAPWFIFSKSNTKMEDWYLALTSASVLKPDTDGVFSEDDMQALVNTIDTEPDPIPMRWFNAMLGRIFFGVYRTEALEQFIIGKIMKKLSRVSRPSFLGPIIIREVNVGTFPPIFSKPMLKDLTAEGTASFEMNLSYRSRPSQPNSQVRITIATSATIPTGFKPYVVNLVLAVVVKSFEGNMVMQIKKPPSNRIWYGFTQMPKLEVEIRPVVSERKIQIGMVLKAIEKQLRDVIAESVVLPNMDDIAFFDTSAEEIRGGIFSSAGKVVNGPTADVPSNTTGAADDATQPGVSLTTSAEDPASATVETAGLRKRPNKSQTMGFNDKAAESEADLPIPRLDTAPLHLASLADTKRSPTRQNTKKWFATGGRPPSVASVSALAHSNGSKESVTTPLANTEDSNNPSSSSALASTPATDTSHSVLPGRGHGKSESISDHMPIRSAGRTSLDSIDTSSTVPANEGGSSASPAQSIGSTTSLMTSIRARDKKAIMTQANTARDAVKKWGVNWAAKRRNPSAADEDKPTPLYRPPDDEVDAGHQSTSALSKSAEAPKTLQERLNAAAAAAAANRPKSGDFSATSPARVPAAKPTLQASPSNTSVSKFGSSPPPQWTLSTAAPTIEIDKGEASTKASPGSRLESKADSSDGPVRSDTVPSTHTSQRRLSNNTPVFTQPTAGRSMVVPHIPKRPGEVVGIGFSEAGITRRISSGQDGAEAPDLPVRPPATAPGKRDPTVLPPLPSRKPNVAESSASKSALSVESPHESGKAGGGGTGPVRSSDPSVVPESDPMPRSDSAPFATTPPSLPERPRAVETQDGGDSANNVSIVSAVEEETAGSVESVEQAQTVPLPSEESSASDASSAQVASDGDGGSAATILRNLQQRDERSRTSSIGSAKDIA